MDYLYIEQNNYKTFNLIEDEAWQAIDAQDVLQIILTKNLTHVANGAGWVLFKVGTDYD